MGWKKWAGLGCGTLLLTGASAVGVGCYVVNRITRSLHDGVSDMERTNQLHYQDQLRAQNPDLFPGRDDPTIRGLATLDSRNNLVYLVFFRGLDTASIKQDGTHLVLNGVESVDPIPNSPRAKEVDPQWGSPYDSIHAQGAVVVYKEGGLTSEGLDLVVQVINWEDSEHRGFNTARILKAFKEARLNPESKENVFSTLPPRDPCANVYLRRALVPAVLGFSNDYRSLNGELTKFEGKIAACR